MCRISAAVALVTAGLAMTAPPAIAQDNAGIDEYSENVPNAGGDHQPSGGDDRGDGVGAGGGDDRDQGQGAAIPAGAADEFQAAGSDGQAAAALAQQTAPTDDGGRRGRPATGSDAGTGDAGGPATERSDGNGGVGGVVDRLVGTSSDDGGMGVVLPIILAATLLGALAFLAARRRSPGASA